MIQKPVQHNKQPVFEDLPSVEQLLTCYSQILANQNVKQWTEYLNKCETNQRFPLLLLEAYESQRSADTLRLQTVLLLVNVIKRNWSMNLDNVKPIIRQRLLAIYVAATASPQERKHINDAIRFIAKQDYPENYQQLYQFMKSVVAQAVQSSEGVLDPVMLAHLKQLKGIAKDQSGKRMYTHKETFANYNAALVEGCFTLSNMCAQVTQTQLSSGSIPTPEHLKGALLLDRITLHLLQTINPDQQDEYSIFTYMISLLILFLQCSEAVGKILHTCIKRTKHICELLQLVASNQNIPRRNQLASALTKYLRSIVFYLGDMQHCYPFSFTSFLPEYMSQLLQLFQANQFLFAADPLIIKATMLSICKLLRTFSYYADEDSFKSCVASRNNRKNYTGSWKTCNTYFYAFFSHETVETLFNIVLKDIYSWKEPYPEQHTFDQEDGLTHDTPQMDNHMHNVANELLHKLVARFRQSSAKLVKQLLGVMLASSFQGLSDQIVSNTLTMLLVLPKVYASADEEATQQLPLVEVFQILQYLYNSKHHLQLFAMLVGKYYQYMQQKQLQHCFTALVELTVDPKSDKTLLYQASSSIKLIMQKRSQELDYSGLGNTVTAIINQFTKFQDLGLVWKLVTLVNNILQVCEFDQGVLQFCLRNSSLRQLVSVKNEILVYPVCDLFENLLLRSSRPQILLELALEFVATNLGRQLDNVDSIYTLWLDIARVYQAEQDPQGVARAKMLALMAQYEAEAKQSHPVLYVGLLQEYFLLGITPLNLADLASAAVELLSENMGDIYAKTAIYSMCATFFSEPNYYNQAFLRSLLQQLQDITDRQSVELSELRTNLVWLISHYLLNNASAFLEFLTSQLQCTEQVFFELWLKNIEYLNNKQTSRLASLSLITSLQRLPPALFRDNLTKIIRIMLSNLEVHAEIRAFLAKRSPQRVSARKQAIKKQNRYANADVKALFKTNFLSVASKYGLDEQVLNQHITDKELLQRLFTNLK